MVGKILIVDDVATNRIVLKARLAEACYAPLLAKDGESCLAAALQNRPDLVVLDLSRVLAGPWCAQLMSDFGAEVIKIERTGVGDDSRGWGPPFVNLSAQERVATYFCSANRGKKSIALDIAKQEDRAEILKLVETADVFVENFKAGSLARF